MSIWPTILSIRPGTGELRTINGVNCSADTMPSAFGDFKMSARSEARPSWSPMITIIVLL